jgi:hypothetical protein
MLIGFPARSVNPGSRPHIELPLLCLYMALAFDLLMDLSRRRVRITSCTVPPVSFFMPKHVLRNSYLVISASSKLIYNLMSLLWSY